MRIVLVSNRLPITVVENDGEIKFKESTGGLVSGLSSYLHSSEGTYFNKAEHIWLGWPGIVADDKSKEEVILKELIRFHIRPVFLSENLQRNFYYGFCNKTIIPIFHNFSFNAIYDENYWNYYKQANESFCNSIIDIIRPEDVVWVHDYHLMLLPKLLRERKQNIPIGFFLHIPFPPFEIFRLLPKKWGTEILKGLLGADLIGFHTDDHVKNFRNCVFNILGKEHKKSRFCVGERTIKSNIFPMGIDFQKFYDAASSSEVQKEKIKLNTLINFKVIISIDRLDYVKGILNRLQGYEIFLNKNKNWHEKAVLILVVVPSPTGSEYYQQLKNQIDELVEKINELYGNTCWKPILYSYRFLPFNTLVAHYTVADVALVTSLSDGMNLIAKEYITTRTNKGGVLILSKMAGASKELENAIIINPNNIEEIADALKEALEMSHDEQIKRNRIMQTVIKNHDIVKWGDDFIQELLAIRKEK